MYLESAAAAGWSAVPTWRTAAASRPPRTRLRTRRLAISCFIIIAQEEAEVECGAAVDELLSYIVEPPDSGGFKIRTIFMSSYLYILLINC